MIDAMMKRLRLWCAERAALDETAGLDARTAAGVRASGRDQRDAA